MEQTSFIRGESQPRALASPHAGLAPPGLRGRTAEGARHGR